MTRICVCFFGGGDGFSLRSHPCVPWLLFKHCPFALEPKGCLKLRYSFFHSGNPYRMKRIPEMLKWYLGIMGCFLPENRVYPTYPYFVLVFFWEGVGSGLKSCGWMKLCEWCLRRTFMADLGESSFDKILFMWNWATKKPGVPYFPLNPGSLIGIQQ